VRIPSVDGVQPDPAAFDEPAVKRIAEDEMVAEFDLHAVDGVTRLRAEDIPLARALRGEVVTDAVAATRIDRDRTCSCVATPPRCAARKARSWALWCCFRTSPRSEWPSETKTTA
jgi:hypothetical protein